MKKILIVAIAAAAFSMHSEASASQPPAHRVDAPRQVVVAAPETDAIAARSRSRGIFRRLLELERRKNAWLRRTFLRV